MANKTVTSHEIRGLVIKRCFQHVVIELPERNVMVMQPHGDLIIECHRMYC